MKFWKTFITTIIGAVIGGLVVASLIFFVVLKTDVLTAKFQTETTAGNGYKLLADHQCRFGQTKHLLMRGVDDDFALGNEELSRRDPRLAFMPGHPANQMSRRDYDETGPDKIIIDYFEVPVNVKSGLFVTRIEERAFDSNEAISIGDFNIPVAETLRQNGGGFSRGLRVLSQQDGWSVQEGNIYSASLDALPSNPESRKSSRNYRHIEDMVRANPEGMILDVLFFDDTAVDFIGFALCSDPVESRGMSFAVRSSLSVLTQDIQQLTCTDELTATPCNPFYGDTLCTEARSVACFYDEESPIPEVSGAYGDFLTDIVNKTWGGGKIEFAPARRGDEFKTVGDVNQYCEKTFGPGWRVLSFHDGGQRDVTSLPSKTMPTKTVWLDIRDQPKGTCWSRGAASRNQELNKSETLD